ncbi:hypothetical protein OROHE_014567 [Orobanche hederae]
MLIMLDYTIELISLAAASNSLAIFCFCNLIVAVLLLVGSSTPPIPPPSNEAERNNNSNRCSDFPNTVDNGHFKKIDTVYSSFGDKTSTKNDLFETEEEGKVTSTSIDMFVDDSEDDDDDETEEEEEEEDDELRKRVEDFIEKINRGWRAEKIKTCVL